MVDRSLSTLRVWVREGALRGYREDPAHPSTSRVMVSREELVRLVVEAGKASTPGRRPPGEAHPAPAHLEEAEPPGGDALEAPAAPVVPMHTATEGEIHRLRLAAAELRGDLRAAYAERDSARALVDATLRTVAVLEARCGDLGGRIEAERLRADTERLRADGLAERVAALEAEREALYRWHGLPWYRRLLAAPALPGGE
jgi:hypothetical protein